MYTPRCLDDISRMPRAWDVFSESMIGKKARNYRTVKVVHFECKYMKHIFELRMKDRIEERSSQLLRNLSSCEKKA